MTNLLAAGGLHRFSSGFQCTTLVNFVYIAHGLCGHPTDQRVIPVGRGGRAAGGGQPVGKSEFTWRRVAVFAPFRALCGSALMAEAVRGDGTSGLFRRAAIFQPIWATQSSFIGQTADHTVVSSLTGDFVPMQALHHRHRHGTDYL